MLRIRKRLHATKGVGARESQERDNHTKWPVIETISFKKAASMVGAAFKSRDWSGLYMRTEEL